MKFEFNGVINLRQDGDDTVLEFIHPYETGRLEALGLNPDEFLSGLRQIGSDGDTNFYCTDKGCSGDCELKNSGSTWWCACIAPT